MHAPMVAVLAQRESIMVQSLAGSMLALICGINTRSLRLTVSSDEGQACLCHDTLTVLELYDCVGCSKATQFIGITPLLEAYCLEASAQAFKEHLIKL
jgi:hypothetical protein